MNSLDSLKNPEPKNLKRIFKSSLNNVVYLFANGKSANFIGSRYITDSRSEIAEFMQEIVEEGFGKSIHPFIYVDSDEKEIDTSLQDRIKEAQAKVAIEMLKEANQKTTVVSMNPNAASTVDAGNNSQAVLASFSAVAPATGISSSAMLASLTKSSNS